MQFCQSLTTISVVLLLVVTQSRTNGFPVGSRADEVINKGTQYRNGKLDDLGWIASGIPKHGCDDSSVKITNCYSMQLTDDPNKMLDTNHLDQPRQRIELPAPHAGNGESFTYTWKYYLSSKTGTGTSFFHNWQLLQRPKDANGGPVITMDAVNDKIAIRDDSCPNNTCPSIPLDKYTDRTVLNTMNVTFGPTGKIDYKLTDAETGEELLACSRDGEVGRDEVNLQFGTYRSTFEGMTVSLAAAGDFNSTKH